MLGIREENDRFFGLEEEGTFKEAAFTVVPEGVSTLVALTPEAVALMVLDAARVGRSGSSEVDI